MLYGTARVAKKFGSLDMSTTDPFKGNEDPPGPAKIVPASSYLF